MLKSLFSLFFSTGFYTEDEPKKLKRRPYWYPKAVPWELNSFSLTPINLHGCCPDLSKRFLSNTHYSKMAATLVFFCFLAN